MSHFSKEILIEDFSQKDGKPQIMISVSGRANIIGEHTDYNEGFVLPFATNQSLIFAARIADKAKIYSYTTDELYDETANTGKDAGFVKYFKNLHHIMENRFGIDKNITCYFGGDLPMGAGVSSSSSICIGLVEIYDILFNLNLTNEDKVNIAGEVEHGIGLRGGKMDQYTIVNAINHHYALLIDCRVMQHLECKIPNGFQFLLINTGVKHNLVHTAYNARRESCETIIKLAKEQGMAVNALRDLSIEALNQIKNLDSDTYNKGYFVIKENDRVHQFIAAMKNEDLDTCGNLLYQSHEGLSHQYQVSCDELDTLVALAKKTKFIKGARMMGGGFGGCTINLYHTLHRDELENLFEEYHQIYGHRPEVHVVESGCGIVRIG